MSDPMIKIPEDVFAAQRLFMRLSGQKTGLSTADLYMNLIREEMGELEEAYQQRNDVAVLDALCDLVVVIAGMGAACAFPMTAAMAEVYRSNFSKIDLSTGKPWKVREDGKVLKDEHYSPPDLIGVLINNIPTVE
jgi:molybdopterin biosynthesis enzyme